MSGRYGCRGGRQGIERSLALGRARAAINDILPVTRDEAWIAGYVSDSQQHPVLYHYQAGSWTSVALPSGVAVDGLRMVSPNDIWASGHISAASNWDADQSAAMLHYDGNTWQSVHASASGRPQYIQAFDLGTAWAFTIDPTMSPDTITSVRYERDGTWLKIKWPFANMSLGIVSLHMNPMQRVSADEYWTIGSPGSMSPVLLYFASGAWHAYGQ